MKLSKSYDEIQKRTCSVVLKSNFLKSLSFQLLTCLEYTNIFKSKRFDMKRDGNQSCESDCLETF